MTACSGRKLCAWTVAVGLALALVILVVATGESIRHADIARPVPQSVAPDAGRSEPRDDPAVAEPYHHPSLPAWAAP